MSFFKRLFSKKKEEEQKKPKPIQKAPIPDKNGMINRSAVIEKFLAPEKIKKDEVLKVEVFGYFTSAGWNIKETSAKLDKNTITLSVVGEIRADRMSAHVIKRYETTIEISGLKKGTYTILAEKGTEMQGKVVVK
jgi:hypothetical protein